jgi:hypothetical protein
MIGLRTEAIQEGDRKLLFERAALGLAAFGLALRLIRYLQNYPLWCDETMLAANLLDRPWAELARPLDYRQVCPLGFLAMEWVAVRWLGFSEATLRLLPFLSALASVPLFMLLARRVLGAGTAGTLVAVGMFAVAQTPIRYAAEFKPYATDLLVATVLLLLALRWREAPDCRQRLWALSASALASLAVSLPSLFVIAAIALVVLADVLAGRRGGLTAVAVFLAVTAAGVAVLAVLGQYHTSPADRAYFLNFWAGGFPPSWHDPWAFARWLVRVHTGPLFAYPHGAIRQLAWLTVSVLGCFLTGIAVRFRRDPGTVALLSLPFLMALAASILRRYPYGMSPRVAQFLVPSTLILAAAGFDWLVARLRPLPLRRMALPGLMGLLVALGLWRLTTDLSRPYRTPWDRTAREFARWFWEELGASGELVCVRTDLGITLGKERWSYDATDQYLCYQRIYSPRHRKGLPPRWADFSPERPLRLVLPNRKPDDVPELQAWIVANQHRYALRDVRTYPATRGSPDEPKLTYVVCELVPVAPDLATGAARESTRR